MNVDFKITTWERISIPDDIKDEVLKRLKNGSLTNSNEIYNIKTDGVLDYEHLSETDEQMSVEENGQQATIEIMEGSTIIWHNKK